MSPPPPRPATRTLSAALALTAMAIAATPCAPAAAAGPTVNGHVLRAALERALTERVDVVGIGDSNQLYQGFGWDHGFHVALEDHFPMYATGLLTQGENGSNGRDVGYRYGVVNNADWRDGGSGTHVGAPAEWQLFCAPFAANTAFEDVHNYTWTHAEHAAAGSAKNGIKVEAACALDPTARLIASICHARFTAPGDGGFEPVWLVDGSVAVAGERVECEAQATSEMAIASLELPADGVRAGLDVLYRFHRHTTEFLGAVFTLYMRVENADRDAGFSYSTWGSHGGRSSRYFANLIVNGDEDVTDVYKHYYFEQVMRLQQDQSRRTVIFWINHGLNDRNETLPSVGPLEIADGSSAAAYADNLQAAIDQINADWTAAGGDEDDVSFVLDPSHPIDVPDDPRLVGYRAAAACVALANPRTAMVDVSAMINADEMAALGYYEIGDRNHLRQAGVEALARLKVDALLAAVPGCDGDADGDGAVGVGDLLTVLAGWGPCAVECAAPCAGDVSGDRAIDVDDLLAVLSDWGCR